MKLSEEERTLVAQLLKRENLYYRLRYGNLILGISCLVIAFGGFSYLMSLSRDAAMRFGNHPIMYLLGIIGGVGIGMAYRGWKGNPQTKLLLSITEKLDGKE